MNRSQFDSSVDVKPLTPVSGDRSSCATVATRSDLSRSTYCRARASRTATARQSDHAAGPVPVQPAGDEDLPTRRGTPRRLEQQRCGSGQAAVRPDAVHPVLAVEVLQGHHLSQAGARDLRVDLEQSQRRGCSPRRRRPRRPRRRARRAAGRVTRGSARSDTAPPPKSTVLTEQVTPGGSGRRACVTCRCSRAERVQAQGRRGGEVEALGRSVDGYPDDLVGQRDRRRRAAPRPHCRTAKRSVCAATRRRARRGRRSPAPSAAKMTSPAALSTPTVSSTDGAATRAGGTASRRWL